MAGRVTTQQFRTREIPESAAVARARQARAAEERSRLRERYAELVAQFSDPAERDSEEARFAHRRYARIMTMDSGHPLRAALTMLEQGQRLTGAEVATIVVGAERGDAGIDAVRRLIERSAQLPAPGVADAIRQYVRESTATRFGPLREY